MLPNVDACCGLSRFPVAAAVAEEEATSTDLPFPDDVDEASWVVEALRCLSAGRRNASKDENISPTGSTGGGCDFGGSGLAVDEGLVGSFWNSAPTGREPNKAPVGRFLPSKKDVETGRDVDADVAIEDVEANDVAAPAPNGNNVDDD